MMNYTPVNITTMCGILPQPINHNNSYFLGVFTGVLLTSIVFVIIILICTVINNKNKSTTETDEDEDGVI
jgi:hypothetical protein